jgi:hypothetical protein
MPNMHLLLFEIVPAAEARKEQETQSRGATID